MSNIPELEAELRDCLDRFEKYYPKYIDAKIIWEQLEASKKFVYHSNMPDDGPEWKARKQAETSQEYKNHCDAISAAYAKKEKGLSFVKPIEMRIDSLRTVISARKEEIRQFSG